MKRLKFLTLDCLGGSISTARRHFLINVSSSKNLIAKRHLLILSCFFFFISHNSTSTVWRKSSDLGLTGTPRPTVLHLTNLKKFCFDGQVCGGGKVKVPLATCAPSMKAQAIDMCNMWVHAQALTKASHAFTFLPVGLYASLKVFRLRWDGR